MEKLIQARDAAKNALTQHEGKLAAACEQHRVSRGTERLAARDLAEILTAEADDLRADLERAEADLATGQRATKEARLASLATEQSWPARKARFQHPLQKLAEAVAVAAPFVNAIDALFRADAAAAREAAELAAELGQANPVRGLAPGAVQALALDFMSRTHHTAVDLSLCRRILANPQALAAEVVRLFESATPRDMTPEQLAARLLDRGTAQDLLDREAVGIAARRADFDAAERRANEERIRRDRAAALADARPS